ncbi:MAG: hypothetical protein AB7H93_22740 [Vicinamibacterales bacterium]
MTSVRRPSIGTRVFTSATTASTASSDPGCAQLASGASGAMITAFRSCSAGSTSWPT